MARSRHLLTSVSGITSALLTLLTGTVPLVALVPPAGAAPQYDIVMLGHDDPEHTAGDGTRVNIAQQLNEAGQVVGYSYRFNGGNDEFGWTAWLYDGASLIDIGLSSAEHVGSDGYELHQVAQLNDDGQVCGNSQRRSGTDFFGWSAWLYDGANTINIGPVGIEHTRNDGYKFSEVLAMNAVGQVFGHAFRYNGGVSDLGRSAWLYNGATTIIVGLTDSEHTGTGGYRYTDSSSFHVNEAGQVVGDSERYNGGNTYLGRSAWLYNGATTVNIGLTGPEHTSTTGYKFSSAIDITESGKVRGQSNRYNGGSADMGLTAWTYNGATTIKIGLTDSEHTRSNGYQLSAPTHLNEAGQVSGFSYRYNDGSVDLGRSAWLYNGTTTINIGLTGPEHTRNDGYKFSGAGSLNAAGQVIGSSNRYNGGSAFMGVSAWLYDGATTIDIGLTDSEHTLTGGRRTSGTQQLNEAGQVRGFSYRYSGHTFLGYSTWLYDGATTRLIGLADSAHTRDDGYRENQSFQLNEAGQVLGVSPRYSGATFLGQDAWLYDPSLDQTFALRLSTRSDGYAFSSADYLGDDGLVLGRYQQYDGMDVLLGERAFYFTIAGGLHDLGSLVDGGLAANGWDYLASVIRANGIGQILGYGKLASQSGGQIPYLLKPINLPGDFNHDNTVDAADYIIWRNGLRTTHTQNDYNLWRAHFGQTTGSGSGATGSASASAEPLSAAVPEPASLALLLIATIVSGCAPRHRKPAKNRCCIRLASLLPWSLPTSA